MEKLRLEEQEELGRQKLTEEARCLALSVREMEKKNENISDEDDENASGHSHISDQTVTEDPPNRESETPLPSDATTEQLLETIKKLSVENNREHEWKAILRYEVDLLRDQLEDLETKCCDLNRQAKKYKEKCVVQSHDLERLKSQNTILRASCSEAIPTDFPDGVTPSVGAGMIRSSSGSVFYDAVDRHSMPEEIFQSADEELPTKHLMKNVRTSCVDLLRALSRLSVDEEVKDATSIKPQVHNALYAVCRLLNNLPGISRPLSCPMNPY